MNKVTKNFLLGTALAGTFVVSEAVDLKIGGNLKALYGHRSGTLNLDAKAHESEGFKYLATEYDKDGGLTKTTETSVASQAFTAEGELDVDIMNGEQDFSYGANITLHGSTSDSKLGSSAAAKRAYVYVKTKYGTFKGGSFEPCSMMLRDSIINKPYVGSGDSPWWLQEYVGKTSILDSAGEEIEDDLMPSVFFMLTPGMYGGNLNYTDEAGELDRDVRYKLVYGGRVAYESPSYKGFKLGVSYQPTARTGTIASLASTASNTTQKKRVKDLWDAALSYKYEMRNGIGFKAYVGYETANMTDHELGVTTSYDKAKLDESATLTDRETAGFGTVSTSASLRFATSRKLNAYELGGNLSYKGFTLTAGCGSNGKELIGDLDIGTIKTEVEGIKTASGNLEGMYFLALNGNESTDTSDPDNTPFISIRISDTVYIIRRPDVALNAVTTASLAAGSVAGITEVTALGSVGVANVKQIVVDIKTYESMAGYLPAATAGGSGTILHRGGYDFKTRADAAYTEGNALTGIDGNTTTAEIGELAAVMDLAAHISSLSDDKVVNLTITSDEEFTTTGSAPDSEDEMKAILSELQTSLTSALDGFKYGADATNGKHKPGLLQGLILGVSNLTAGSQDVYKAWNGKRSAAKFYHLGLHYNKGAFGASARYRNTKRPLFGAQEANEMSRVEVSVSYKIAPGFRLIGEGSFQDNKYTPMVSVYTDPSKAEMESRKVKMFFVGGMLEF